MIRPEEQKVTEERCSTLWSEYVPGLPFPTGYWQHWLQYDHLTLIEGLLILAQVRFEGRFDDRQVRTGDDYGKYLSGILRNIAVVTVPVTFRRGYRITAGDRERFSRKCAVSPLSWDSGRTACMEWIGSPSADYPRFHINRKPHYAHVVAFFMASGDYLPIHTAQKDCSLHVDHVCKNKRCVNPHHLRLVEAAFNCSIRRNPQEPIPIEDPGEYELCGDYTGWIEPEKTEA